MSLLLPYEPNSWRPHRLGLLRVYATVPQLLGLHRYEREINVELSIGTRSHLYKEMMMIQGFPWALSASRSTAGLSEVFKSYRKIVSWGLSEDSKASKRASKVANADRAIWWGRSGFPRQASKAPFELFSGREVAFNMGGQNINVEFAEPTPQHHDLALSVHQSDRCMLWTQPPRVRRFLSTSSFYLQPKVSADLQVARARSQDRSSSTCMGVINGR